MAAKILPLTYRPKLRAAKPKLALSVAKPAAHSLTVANLSRKSASPVTFRRAATFGALPIMAACAKTPELNTETLAADQPDATTANIFSEHPYITGGTAFTFLASAAVMFVQHKLGDILFRGAANHISSSLWQRILWIWQWHKVGDQLSDDDLFEVAVSRNNPLAIKALLARASRTNSKQLSYLNQLATRYPEHARLVVNRLKELVISEDKPSPALDELITLSLKYVAFSGDALAEISRTLPTFQLYIKEAITKQDNATRSNSGTLN